jgi:two-component system C4-dicarboxylate transport response regulator DctD
VRAPVVYIDDEASICRVVRARLEAAGLSVETFTDPEGAIAWLQGHDAHCVLCDYRMPGISGVEVVERLGGHIPFYLVTGDLTPERELAGHPGVRGVIQKPFSFEALVALLRGLPG